MSIQVVIKCDGPTCRKRRDVCWTTEGRKGLRATTFPNKWSRSNHAPGHDTHFCSQACAEAWHAERFGTPHCGGKP